MVFAGGRGTLGSSRLLGTKVAAIAVKAAAALYRRRRGDDVDDAIFVGRLNKMI
jgi:hypothetical protein